MSRDSKNIAQAVRFLRENGYNNARSIVNKLRNEIPNSRLPKNGNGSNVYKYIYGLCRMYCKGELNDPQTISDINTTIEYVASEAHINEYDRDFNGLSAKELNERFKGTATYNLKEDMKRSSAKTYTKNEDYEIVKIDSFEKASQYSKYTDWCVTLHDGNYKGYTAQGTGMFYFVLKKGFENVEKKNDSSKGALDEYGLSMIAVSVKMNGALNTVTSRWNHEISGYGDSIMTQEEIENLIGMSFYEAFPGRTKEELRALGFSEKLGTLYRGEKDGFAFWGIVTSVDKNNRVKTVMSPYWIKNIKDGLTNMNWNDAKESVSAYKQPELYGNENQIPMGKGPWQLGSEEVLTQTMKHKEFINTAIEQIQKRQENGENILDILEEHMRIYHSDAIAA